MQMTVFQRIESGVAGRLLRASDAFVERMTQSRWEVDGQPLDRRTQYMFTVGRFAERSIPKLTLAQARRYYARLNRVLEAPPPEIGREDDITIPTRSGPLPARAYYPEGVGDEQGPLPGLVYYHGGGFTIGSIETHDTLCRRLCKESECTVVSVEYRLAPEYPFPAAIDDGRDAYHWVRDHAGELAIDPSALAVGGDSAGGNLAAVVCSLARDEGRPMPRAQLLIYPGVGRIDHPGRSKPELQTGYGLDAKTLWWFVGNYMTEEEADDPRTAPLLLSSHAGLPPAIVVTAKFDLLCEEGVEYAKKLAESGVPVEHLHAPDLPHGFGTMSVIPRAREAISELADALRKELHR